MQMKNTLNFKSVKEQRDIETNELTGYLVDGISVPLDEGNRHYQEVLEWLKTNTPEPAFTQAELDAQKANELKQAKQKALDSITVTVGTNVFDGRDKDQVRMMSALKASAILGQTSTNWKLHNNTTVTVTTADLEQALALSIQEVGRIVNATTIEEL